MVRISRCRFGYNFDILEKDVIDHNVDQLKTAYVQALNAKCSIHNKPFKSIMIETNTLLCADCMTEKAAEENSKIVSIQL